MSDSGCRNHRECIGTSATEGHQVKEIVHKGCRIHQQNKNQADCQQEDIREYRLLMFVELLESCRKKILFRHGIKHSDGLAIWSSSKWDKEKKQGLSQ